MKKFYLKAFLLLALSCFTVACNDEPENPDNIISATIPTSYLKYDGKYFELTKGFYFPFGDGKIGRSYIFYHYCPIKKV